MNPSIIVYFIVGAGMNFMAQLTQSIATMVEQGRDLNDLAWQDFGEVQLFILVFGASVQAAHSAYGRWSRDKPQAEQDMYKDLELKIDEINKQQVLAKAERYIKP